MKDSESLATKIVYGILIVLKKNNLLFKTNRIWFNAWLPSGSKLSEYINMNGDSNMGSSAIEGLQQTRIKKPQQIVFSCTNDLVKSTDPIRTKDQWQKCYTDNLDISIHHYFTFWFSPINCRGEKVVLIHLIIATFYTEITHYFSSSYCS